MSAAIRFARGSRPEGSSHRETFLIRCAKCGRMAHADGSRQNGASQVFLAKRFRAMGWTVGPRASGDLCPEHTGPRPHNSQPLSQAQRRAAWCSIEGVARKKEDQPVNTKPTLVVAPVAQTPRAPTREDRRKIVEELETFYDVDGQRYRAAHSDATMAAHLDMPRAWITEERERMYGPDVNEAADARDAEIKTLIAQAKALEERGMALAADAELLRGALLKLLK